MIKLIKNFFDNCWFYALAVGGWVTTVMLMGVVLKLNSYIFMLGWNLV